MSTEQFNFNTPVNPNDRIHVTVEGVGEMGCQGFSLGDCTEAVVSLITMDIMTNNRLERDYELVSYDPDEKILVARKRGR